ncbi:MAG: leucine-rich repeat domain-containing protein [Myxococcales bacterium]|nr:leucine-rich repeat domain-containing protein [Myxococcales bacterium]
MGRKLGRLWCWTRPVPVRDALAVSGPHLPALDPATRIDAVRRDAGLTLDLSGCGLGWLPSEACALPWLEVLRLEDNALTALNPEIGRLRSLHTLELGFNALTRLPDELFTLEHLRALDLSGNRLRALPAQVARLRRLSDLRVVDNPLVLPDALWSLPELREVHLDGEQWRALPEPLRASWAGRLHVV